MQKQNLNPDPERIRKMFAQVAVRYDKANSVLSVGIHHLWRRKVVSMSGVCAGDKILDCATGTGDLAIEFKKKVGPSGTVIGTDFCPEMLATAPKKAKDLGLDVKFETANVMALPYADDEFDISSISFGIRNVADPAKGLAEMARVTRQGGSVLVLEFGQVHIPGLKNLYSFYSEKVLPLIGGWVTGQKEAYQYLQKSSANFPCRQEFVDLALQTGKFSAVTWTPLTGGVAYIYKAVVK